MIEVKKRVNWLEPCTLCNTDHYMYSDCDELTVLKIKYESCLDFISDVARNVCTDAMTEAVILLQKLKHMGKS